MEDGGLRMEGGEGGGRADKDGGREGGGTEEGGGRAGGGGVGEAE